MNSLQHVVTNMMLFCLVMVLVAISLQMAPLIEAVSAASCAAEEAR